MRNTLEFATVAFFRENMNIRIAWPRDKNVKVEALRGVSAFEELSEAELSLIARHLDEVEVEAGTRLIVEGHRNEAFWVLLDGEVEISAGQVPLRRLVPGSVFGAMTMLDGRASAVTAVTATPIRALVAGPDQFRALAGNQQLSLRLKAIWADRTREDQLAQLS
jgi:CRP-like cAMP-binding protein